MQTAENQHIRLIELFDALPESVILFKPVWNNEPTPAIIDFEAAYCNEAASRFLNTTKDKIIGNTVLRNRLVDKGYSQVVFRQCLQVWISGHPHEEDFYNQHLQRYFTALRSKITEGVLSITRDRTPYYLAEQELQKKNTLLNTILNASVSAIYACEAVRGEESRIIDFRFLQINKKYTEIIGLQAEEVVGKSFLGLFPQTKETGFFDLLCHVIETGTEAELEMFYDGEWLNNWFQVSAVKVDDGVVVTFNDITESKRDKETLQHNASQLYTIINTSPSGICTLMPVKNEKGDIVDFKMELANAALAQYVQQTPEMLTGELFSTWFATYKTNGLFQKFCDTYNNGLNNRFDFHYNDDGLDAWLDTVCSRIDGEMLVTFNDFTPVKKLQLELQSSMKELQTSYTDLQQYRNQIEQNATRLSTIINTSQAGLFMGRPVYENGQITDFCFTLANKMLAQFTGQTPEALIGELGSRWFARYKTNGLFDAFKNTFETGKTQRFEFYYEGASVDAWIDLMTVRLGDEVLGTFTDHTPVKRLQQEIEKSAIKLTTVFNASQAGMFTLKPVKDDSGTVVDFTFVVVNEAVGAYIGQTAETLTGALASIYFPAYKTNGLFNIYLDTLLNGTTHSFDFHYEDGYDVYFNIHTTNIGDEVLVTFTDQTSLKRLQVDLEASIEELKRSNASLEEFAYAASHDLQEPLRKIYFFSEKLRLDIGDRLNESEQKILERMENATTRMRTLINDLLMYSQVSMKQSEFTTVNLQAIARQVLQDLEAAVLEKAAQVHIGHLPDVQGDAVQLTQAFQNLVSNALKYSRPGVAPVISLHAETITKTANGVSTPYHVITIQDNGIGFAQDDADRIFKVFHRLHGRSEYPGTGIGLAIVQKVVHNHHGTIKAEGKVNEGATFKIWLPA